MISTQCSKYVELFLCSVYSPACTEFGVVPPCRDLCETVLLDCKDIMASFDIQWPGRLSCSNFPEFLQGRALKPEQIYSSYDDDGLVIITRPSPLIWEEMLLDSGNVSFYIYI